MSQPRSLVDRLGDAELAQLVRVEAVGALTNACDDASHAHRSSQYSDGFTYGTTRWRYGLGWVADTLCLKAAGEVVKFGHMRLTLIGSQPGCLVYPIAVGNTAKLDPQMLQIKPSRLRQALFGDLQPAQLTLEFDDPDTNGTDLETSGKRSPTRTSWPGTAQNPPAGYVSADGLPADDVAAGVEEAGEAELEDAELGDADLTGARSAGGAVLLLVYTSNPKNGLLGAVIGEAVMAEDGTLTFLWCEQLQVRGDGGDGGLHLIDPPKPIGPDFAIGAEPEIITPVRRTAERAIGGTHSAPGLADEPAGAPADEAR